LGHSFLDKPSGPTQAHYLKPSSMSLSVNDGLCHVHFYPGSVPGTKVQKK
jgi:hypothetical protein